MVLNKCHIYSFV